MGIPRRIRRQTGRLALVDGIPFHLPVNSEMSPALMAAFTVEADRAASLVPGNELHPFRLLNGRGLILITVIDYHATDIGKYIEFSIAIACTHGAKPAPALLPALFQQHYGVGQYVYDLPVSTEISVKGGKGIWGMPKHRASLDFLIDEDTVSSQYDLDGQMVMRIDIDRPKKAWLPVNMGAANYCQFRGMLMKSYIYFKSKVGFTLFNKAAARLTLGEHPRCEPLHSLDINPQPLFTAFMPASNGVLNDYFECWFITYEKPPTEPSEGLESVVHLGSSRAWPPPPNRSAPSQPPVVTKASDLP